MRHTDHWPETQVDLLEKATPSCNGPHLSRTIGVESRDNMDVHILSCGYNIFKTMGVIKVYTA